MLLIGAHMSISGGLPRAIERGCSIGCATIQIFTKNANRWRAKPIPAGEVRRFREAAATAGIAPILSHDSYLINLASPKDDLYEKSIAAMEDELDRAEDLGLLGVVIHPGAHTGAGEKKGLERVARALDGIHRRKKGYRAKILLETTAGQGTCLGHRFEHLAAIIDMAAEPGRLAVCFDTCHVFAAGYDIRTARSFGKVLEEFDAVIGLDRLAAIHLNDSLKELGSRRDRHTHIGEGEIGLEAFRFLMKNPRLKKIPKILETPKGEEMAEDVMNLETLRRLAARGKGGERERGGGKKKRR